MIEAAGSVIGLLVASYYALFRTDAVRAKYGSLDLHNWFSYVLVAWALLAWASEVTIWAVQYALWATGWD